MKTDLAEFCSIPHLVACGAQHTQRGLAFAWCQSRTRKRSRCQGSGGGLGRVCVVCVGVSLVETSSATISRGQEPNLSGLVGESVGFVKSTDRTWKGGNKKKPTVCSKDNSFSPSISLSCTRCLSLSLLSRVVFALSLCLCSLSLPPAPALLPA